MTQFLIPLITFSGPFATNAPVGSFPDVNSIKLQLMKEEWFHGPISRLDAENLLKNASTFDKKFHLTWTFDISIQILISILFFSRMVISLCENHRQTQVNTY